MAQKVQVVLVDDIDGGTADETVSFSLDGVSYEIDLSTANATALREAFAPYVGPARRVGGRSRAGRKSGTSRSRTSSAQIREWGRSHGFDVSERGRISAELRAAYDKANG
ncbi:Lsr2 family protein [Isoptericola sp. b441]|uniref:Lsr2 family protein n=1 Tax=Actinotalea lenta TaxID=3064654 RepID=A0ABT9DCF4_9CELL|nr:MULTISPECIES: Lsr2 family protein [unclassified Isoptericola]MDO8106602.1 Lsr2 family protein [Isoptericola sp. b441]MDO8121690.1 Lsr2 family protein [Isoptericola sp. b490]